MDLLNLLQWPGLVFRLGGAPLVSSRADHLKRWGFICWLVSNVCWIIWAIHTGGWALFAMQVFFCITSAQGWWNHRPGMMSALATDTALPPGASKVG